MGFGYLPGGVGGVPPATIIVATSSSRHKANADYICDGVNDQVEINSAISNLPATGGSIYLLEGTYVIGDTINVNKDKVEIFGDGDATVVKFKDHIDVDKNGFTVTGDYVTIRNLRLDGNRINQSSGYQSAIFTQNTVYSKFCNLTIHDWREHAINIYCTYPGYSRDIIIANNNIYNITGGSTSIEAILVGGYNYNVSITGNTIKSTGRVSVYFGNSPEPCTHCSFVGNTCYDAGGEHGHVWLRGQYITISGNTFYNGSRFIDCDSGGKYNVISGNIFNKATGYSAVRISTGSGYNVITGNLFNDCRYGGIYMTNSSYNAITGNRFVDCGSAAHNTYDAIQMNTTCTKNVISGNTFVETQANKARYGVNENTADCNYNEVCGNTFNGFATAAIRLQGANSEQAHNI